MCMFSKPKMPPPPAQFQQMQAPKDATLNKGRDQRRRRGMWASIFTSPQGVTAAPVVTGSTGGTTGG